MSSLFNSLADKAQSMLSGTPLGAQIAQHRPGTHSGTSDDEQVPANQAAAQGGYNWQKSHTLGTLQHQMRVFQQQYSSSTTPLQRTITAAKGVALDYEGVARDSKSSARDIYVWGQAEDADIKDVSDRLAYLSFTHGALASKLSTSLNAARQPLKQLREAESRVGPKRANRVNLQNQIAKIEHDQQRGMEARLSELKRQLARAEQEDEATEKEVAIVVRKAVRESETAKWAALREFGEKLVLLADASTSVIAALPPLPPSQSNPYNGTQTTAAARAAVQHALDTYKPGILTHAFTPSAVDLSRSDSRSFGVTHESELSSIAAESASTLSYVSGPASPPAPEPHPTPAPSAAPQPINTQYSPPPVPPNHSSQSSTPSTGMATSPRRASIPLDVSALNTSPASIPKPNSPTAHRTSVGGTADAVLPITAENAQESAATMPTDEPTIAETGVPISAGASGPGPAHGSLQELKEHRESVSSQGGGPGSPLKNTVSPPPSAAPGYTGTSTSASTWPSVADEKARLQSELNFSKTGTGAGAAPTYNTPSFAGGAGAGPSSSTAPAGQQPKYETAEDEKKRLEREERERLLAAGGSQNVPHGEKKDGFGDDGGEGAPPPPYQDF